MNILSNLTPAKGSVRSRKRVGRGEGSGLGSTSGRGSKGAGSRSGYKSKRHHEGGQTPIQMRLPKRGFKNINRVEYVPFNLSDLQRIAEKHNLSALSFDALRKLRLVKQTDKIKILGDGQMNTRLDITAHAFSEKAKNAIEKAGGTANVL